MHSLLSASETLLVGYETSETTLSISSPDSGMTLTKVLGGISGTPAATQGSYVLKAIWTGQTDRKVEIRHNGLNYNLAGFEKALVDVFIPTGAALFQSNGKIGFWSDNWLPDNWSQGDILPTENNKWFTITMDVSSFNPGQLDHISALVLENYGADNGTVYVDNIRLFSCKPTGLTATGHDRRIDLRWEPVAGVTGYNIYRANSAAGPFTKINTSLDSITVRSDFLGTNGSTKYYYVTSVISGIESSPTDIVSAETYAMTDEQLLNSIQEATFRYCWDFAHPDSGMIRERFAAYDRQTVTTGGSGFGLFNIIVGAERGWITRTQAAERTLKMVSFLQDNASRYHGVWSHWMNGTTGVSIPADHDSNGNPIISGDIVETSYAIAGMLAARQYFDANNTTETQIRARTTQLWEEVEWDFYRRASDTDGTHLWWYWSPDTGWDGSFGFGGAEVLITYILAIASPTHSIPPSCYYDGFGGGGGYKNGNRYYGYTQWVSPFETPMFWTHYSFLGFDPRDKNDNYCNYFENSRNIALIDRAYCAANPKGFIGYSDLVWGLTDCYSPPGFGYNHRPGNTDDGTIAPTSALSSMPYTPTESIATMKHFYYTYGSGLWGPFGFYDAFNLDQSWYCNDYLAIDQGTIVPMIENYRTGLCWDLFMANPEIWQMLDSIGWATRADNGLNYEYYEGTWTSLPDFDLLTPTATGIAHNFDIGLRQRDDYFAMRFTGYFDIQSVGGYTFYLSSDDGSRLYIDGVLLIDNDGQHSVTEESGYKYLLTGRHSITVEYLEYDGNNSLLVSYSKNTIPKKQMPVNILFRCDLAGDFTGDCLINFHDLKILTDNWLTDYDFLDFAKMAQNWLN